MCTHSLILMKGVLWTFVYNKCRNNVHKTQLNKINESQLPRTKSCLCRITLLIYDTVIKTPHWSVSEYIARWSVSESIARCWQNKDVRYLLLYPLSDACRRLLNIGNTTASVTCTNAQCLDFVSAAWKEMFYSITTVHRNERVMFLLCI